MTKTIDKAKNESLEMRDSKSYIRINPPKRLSAARSVFGSWKHRSDKEIDEKLRELREGWERSLTAIR